MHNVIVLFAFDYNSFSYFKLELNLHKLLIKFVMISKFLLQLNLKIDNNLFGCFKSCLLFIFHEFLVPAHDMSGIYHEIV